MTLFLIKKTFFDMWDNLLTIVLLNLGFLAVLGVGFYLLTIMNSPPLFLLTVIVFLGCLTVYIGATSRVAKDIANYQSPEFRAFFNYLSDVWKPSVVFALTIIAQFLIFEFVIPWYLKTASMIGLAIASILFWISLTWLLTSQYYFPVMAQLDTNSKKIFRKCFILFFDNKLFTLGLAFGVIILLLLSSFVVFLLPGIGTILLWHQVGLKLRLYKYDYLETHPEAKKIPWDSLLAAERERVGHRTLRGMIFPWKD